MFTNDSETDPAEWSLKMETVKLLATNSSSVHKKILLYVDLYYWTKVLPPIGASSGILLQHITCFEFVRTTDFFTNVCKGRLHDPVLYTSVVTGLKTHKFKD